VKLLQGSYEISARARLQLVLGQHWDLGHGDSCVRLSTIAKFYRILALEVPIFGIPCHLLSRPPSCPADSKNKLTRLLEVAVMKPKHDMKKIGKFVTKYGGTFLAAARLIYDVLVSHALR
jgi:hypothetical protein